MKSFKVTEFSKHKKIFEKKIRIPKNIVRFYQFVEINL